MLFGEESEWVRDIVMWLGELRNWVELRSVGEFGEIYLSWIEVIFYMERVWVILRILWV